MKKKILDLNIFFNEESKNFEMNIKTYKYKCGVCLDDTNNTNLRIDYSIIKKIINILESLEE